MKLQQRRKLVVDPPRGVIALGERASVNRLQFRASNAIGPEHGAANARPTSFRKVVQNRANAKRSCTDLAEASKSNASHNERMNLPKYRVNSAIGFQTHTPRLEHLPSESVGKSDSIRPNFSSLPCNVVDKNIPKSTEGTPFNPDKITSMTVPQSHGHGDSIKVLSADEFVQHPQQQQQHGQQDSNQAATVNQQRVPIEQRVDRTYQSEASPNKQAPSLGTRSHRPFVPHVMMHGSTLRELSMGKADGASPHAPVRKSSTLSMQYQGESREHACSGSADQAHRYQSLVPQQKSQISQQSMARRINDDAGTTLRESDPPEGDSFFAKPDYGKYPAVNECDTVRQPLSISQGKFNDQQTIITIGQPTTQRDITAGDTGGQPEDAVQLQRSYQTQQPQRYVNRREQSTVNGVENAQKMYQQMRDNMIRQRQMQQRVSNQQQQMLLRAQQQIASQPTLRHARTSTQQSPLLNSQRNSNIIPLQHSHLGQTAMPHHEMLMQQRSIRDQTLKVYPQNAWVNNHRVVVANPNVNDLSKRRTVDELTMDEKTVPPNNALPYESPKLDHSHCRLKAEQRIVDQQTNIHGGETVPCPWYGKASDKYSPSLYVRQTRNPVPTQRYSTAQQEGDVSMWDSEAAAVHSHRQSECQHPQPRQEYEPVSTDQRFGMPKHFSQLPTRCEQRNVKKKYADFTSAMLRDQELLVLNMRQQKIPEDTMRRQFDALLAEQRRQLSFLDQVESVEIKNDALLRRNCRISSEDQRPDWMGRITPARITARQVRRSGSDPSQWVADGHREERRHDPKQTERYSERQRREPQQSSDDSQCTTIVAHQRLDPSDTDNCQLHRRHADNWECNAGQPPSLVHTSGVLRRSASPPRAIWRCSQLGNSPTSDPLRTEHDDRRCDIRTQLHQGAQQRILEQPQPLHGQHERHRRNDASPCDNSNTCEQQRDPNVKCDKPSSLLKLREYKRYIRLQGRNNGLQDAGIVQGMLKTLERSECGEDLGYVANLGNKTKAVKFNGTQDPSELGKLLPPPVEYLERIQQFEGPKISANGLSNTRNADNPASPPKRFTDKTDRTNSAPSEGYPRQCHPGEKLAATFKHGSQNLTAERENERIIGGVRQRNRDTSFQALSEGQHSSQRVDAVDGPVQPMAIPSNGGDPIKSRSHGNFPIIPYKFNSSQPQYRQQIDRFCRNQRNLNIFAGNATTETSTEQPSVLNGSDSTAQVPWTGTDPVVQPKLRGVRSKTVADLDLNRQELAPILQTVANPDRSSTLAHDPQTFASNVANVACGNGQPEIRQPRVIGGFTYLARKVDYIQNPTLIAPNSLIASKFLQPLIGFN